MTLFHRRPFFLTPLGKALPEFIRPFFDDLTCADRLAQRLRVPWLGDPSARYPPAAEFKSKPVSTSKIFVLGRFDRLGQPVRCFGVTRCWSVAGILTGLVFFKNAENCLPPFLMRA